MLTFAQLISLCSENKSAPPPEPHADTSFLNSDKSIIKPISVNDHVQEGPLPEKSTAKALSLNEHVLLVCSKRKYPCTSAQKHSIDPSASFDLITESCMSPVYNNQLVQPLSDAKDSSMDIILAQQYEDCAIQAEANFQLQLVNNLASKFTACSKMINAEECLNNKFATSLQGQSSRSEIPIIIATDAERYFYDKFTSDIPNNMQRYVDYIYCFFAVENLLIIDLSK